MRRDWSRGWLRLWIVGAFSGEFIGFGRFILRLAIRGTIALTEHFTDVIRGRDEDEWLLMLITHTSTYLDG